MLTGTAIANFIITINSLLKKAPCSFSKHRERNRPRCTRLEFSKVGYLSKKKKDNNNLELYCVCCVVMIIGFMFNFLIQYVFAGFLNMDFAVTVTEVFILYVTKEGQHKY